MFVSVKNRQVPAPISSFTVKHNANAANDGDRVWGGFNLTNLSRGIFSFGQNNTGFYADNENDLLLIDSRDLDQEDFTVLDVSSITTETQVFLYYEGENKASLRSNTASGANSFFQGADGTVFPILHDPNISNYGVPISINGSGEFEADLSIFTNDELLIFAANGKAFDVRHESSPSSILLYVNDTSSNPQTNRLVHVSPGGDSTIQTIHPTQAASEYGVAFFNVYFNETADPEDRLQHRMAFIPFDIFVNLITANKCIKLKYNPIAHIGGAELYYNENNAADELFEFDSPTSADSSFKVSTERRSDEALR